MRMDLTAISEKLDRHSIPVPFSGCFIWMRGKDGTGKYGRGGYGYMRIEGKAHYVHRLAYEAHVGEIPVGMMVCHSCDVRACVNPHHLFLGTARDNHNDKIAKGRDRSPGVRGDRHPSKLYPWIRKGENNGNAKLTRSEVENIRLSYESGTKQNELAARYGIGASQMSRICRWKVWP